MKARKKLGARIASLALAILMIFVTMPVDAFAQETMPATESTTIGTSNVVDSGAPDGGGTSDKPTLGEPTLGEPTLGELMLGAPALGEPTDVCTCVALCTEGNHNTDCPVCKDGLAKCAFVAPAVAMKTRGTGKTIYCGTPTGGQLGDGLTPQTPVSSLKYAAELAEGGTIYMTSEIRVKNNLVVDGLGATVKAYSTLDQSMIYIQNDAEVTLSNLTFDGANFPSDFNWEMIQVGEGTLTLGSGVTLQNCKSSGNSATALTIYPYATVIIDGGSITNNQCGTSIDGTAGGGVTIKSGTLQLKSGSITGNTLYDGTTPSDVKVPMNNGTFIMNGSATVGTVVFLDGWNPSDCGTTKIELTSALASDVIVRRGYDGRSLAVGRVVAQGGNGYTLTAADIAHLKLLPNEAVTSMVALKSDTNQAVIKSKPHTIKADPNMANGALAFDSPTAYVGDTVSFTATPAEGYFADKTIFEISFRGSTQSWPVTYANGKYSFTIPSGTNSNPNTILVFATFKPKTDTVAPTVTPPTVTLADKKATVTMACTNTAGTGDGEYTSDLAYYAVVIDQNLAAPIPPEVGKRTAITNNMLPASWTESKAVDRVGNYYAHLFVWDTAGNHDVGTTMFLNPKPQTLDDATHAQGGGFLYKMEYGVDTAVPLTMTNTTSFDKTDTRPNPLVSFSLKDPSQTVITLVDGKITPAGIGSTTIVAKAGATASHFEKTQEITAEVKLPIAVCLAVGTYDSDGKNNNDGLTVNPSYTYGWYDANDASRTLQIRKSGETAWTTIPVKNWDWNADYVVPFQGLEADTVYELSLSVSDRNSTPHTAQSSISFLTPKAQVTHTGGIEGSVSGTGKITVSVEWGNDIIASVGGLNTGDSFKFTNLPDGEYNLVATTSEHKVTQKVTVKDGKTTQINVVAVGNKQSAVKMHGGPRVAVGGLPVLFGTPIFMNNADATGAVANGGTVEMRLTSGRAKPTEADEIRKKVTNQRAIGMLFDFSLDMFIMPGNGYSTVVNISETETLLEIAFLLPDDIQNKTGIQLLHCHDGNVNELKQIGEADTPNGECFRMIGKYGYLYTTQLSAYALTYDKFDGGGESGGGETGGGVSSGGESGGGVRTPNAPKTGDTSNTMLYLGLIVLSGGVAGFGLKKKKLK